MQTPPPVDEPVDEPAGVPPALSPAWPHLPDHAKLAILARVEPYRHLGAGVG